MAGLPTFPTRDRVYINRNSIATALNGIATNATDPCLTPEAVALLARAVLDMTQALAIIDGVKA